MLDLFKGPEVLSTFNALRTSEHWAAYYRFLKGIYESVVNYYAKMGFYIGMKVLSQKHGKTYARLQKVTGLEMTFSEFLTLAANAGFPLSIHCANGVKRNLSVKLLDTMNRFAESEGELEQAFELVTSGEAKGYNLSEKTQAMIMIEYSELDSIWSHRLDPDKLDADSATNIDVAELQQDQTKDVHPVTPQSKPSNSLKPSISSPTFPKD